MAVNKNLKNIHKLKMQLFLSSVQLNQSLVSHYLITIVKVVAEEEEMLAMSVVEKSIFRSTKNIKTLMRKAILEERNVFFNDLGSLQAFRCFNS